MRKIILTVVFLLSFIISMTDPSGTLAKPIKKDDIYIIIDPLKNHLKLFVNGALYKTYPIALGKRETPTPVGDLKVINKSRNWGSGFGTRWIGLDVPWGTYGIHGTNNPYSIGTDTSHGCIRMLNQHVEQLYEFVEIGTRVTILGHVLGEPQMEPRRLAKGDSGADVQLIQHLLQNAGYFKGTCNGKFGPSTERALLAFEKEHSLPIDGIMSQHDYMELGLLE
ncbi:L,D-transpeptidase family protein [Paenibacillus sp. GP183]|jgi:hypothetical protein|uniref:L,D-transpeptidase family protein n=1 Tax=Paenibacillus sp. GP183 TaxID=1882751 RepID=UPI0008983965|nr:L,D-transpeptidase family protein [Paenibacillus sp. GP183]SEB62541.1 Putative peptidoglycan binding domain-containing protein [Paenibacillus sp. GP183]